MWVHIVDTIKVNSQYWRINICKWSRNYSSSSRIALISVSFYTRLHLAHTLRDSSRSFDTNAIAYSSILVNVQEILISLLSSLRRVSIDTLKLFSKHYVFARFSSCTRRDISMIVFFFFFFLPGFRLEIPVIDLKLCT